MRLSGDRPGYGICSKRKKSRALLGKKTTYQAVGNPPKQGATLAEQPYGRITAHPTSSENGTMGSASRVLQSSDRNPVGLGDFLRIESKGRCPGDGVYERGNPHGRRRDGQLSQPLDVVGPSKIETDFLQRLPFGRMSGIEIAALDPAARQPEMP